MFRRYTLFVTALLAIVIGLSGCFLFPGAPIAYHVGVSYYGPKGSVPFCYGLEVKATFGENILVDASFSQDDLWARSNFIEARSSNQQRYYAGMPLVVDVVCLDDAANEIGSASYEGALVTPNEGAHFTIWNYVEPSVFPDRCVTPKVSAGVQVCASARGFEFP